MMQKKTRNRFFQVFFGIIAISFGVYLILNSLSDNILFYYPPSEIPNSQLNKTIRIGGLVKKDSIKKIDIKTIHFTLIDDKSEILVSYQGILPNLFREKQGIVATGIYNGQMFKATSLLAKHDENYKPK